MARRRPARARARRPGARACGRRRLPEPRRTVDRGIGMLQAAVPMNMVLQRLRRYTVSASAAPVRTKENAPDLGRRRARTGDEPDGVTRRDARRWGRGSHPMCHRRARGLVVASCRAGADVHGGRRRCRHSIFDALDPPDVRTSRPERLDSRHVGGSVRSRAHGGVHRPIRGGVERSQDRDHATGPPIHDCALRRIADFGGLRTQATWRGPVHHGGETAPSIARTMPPARRNAPQPPTHRARPRARSMTAALAGGVAGLAAVAACVAWPPERGQGEATRAPSPSKVSVPQADHRSRWPHTPGVATVLAPAGEAGLLPPRGGGDEDGSP